jgi:hypothetical protein
MDKYRVQLNDGVEIDVEADDFDILSSGALSFGDEKGNIVAVFKAETWEYVVKVDEKKKNKCRCDE